MRAGDGMDARNTRSPGPWETRDKGGEGVPRAGEFFGTSDGVHVWLGALCSSSSSLVPDARCANFLGRWREGKASYSGKMVHLV